MPTPRISMRKIRDVLRLRWQSGLSYRQIASSLGLGHSTIADYLRRAEVEGLSWPLPDELSDARLEAMLFAASAGKLVRPAPDWSQIHQDMGRKGVTLQLLWQEYKAVYPEGYGYSRFCDRYRAWKKKLDLVMRQDHRFGEKMFVDYSGGKIPITDPETGEIKQAEIFVAVLGASNYTYAEASWSQSLKDWIYSHQRALRFFGGVPEIIVPDNLKAAVTRADRYEPEINLTYQDMARHYGTAIIPTRARKPRDKAKVEAAVLLAQRWILAALRNHQFFSLTELNEAIDGLLDQLNGRPFKKLDGCRRSHFEQFERPCLKPLPAANYEFAHWKKARVHVDYHVDVDSHYYSVPHSFARQQVDVRLSENTVEIFAKGLRIASHMRNMRKGRHTTVKAHMPASHRHYADWTPERIVEWAAKTGPSTAELVRRIMASRSHPQQGYRSCLGILRLGDSHGKDRLEAASRRALAINALTYKSLASILKHGLDAHPLPENDEHAPTTTNWHNNIRGAAYYAEAPQLSMFNATQEEHHAQSSHP